VLPDTAMLPALTTQRQRMSVSVLKNSFGIEPFTLMEAPIGGLSRQTSRASERSVASGETLGGGELEKGVDETSALPVQSPLIGSEKIV
jgi:hypothetical protein